MRAIPASAIVLGGGPVALEMAHYLEALGSKVTILQRNTQLLTGSDRDVAEAMAEGFRRRGIEVLCGTSLRAIDRSEQGMNVRFEHGNGELSMQAAIVVNALGRRPALAGLGLEKAGVALEGPPSVPISSSGQRRDISLPPGLLRPLRGGSHRRLAGGDRGEKRIGPAAGGEPASLDYRLKLFACFAEPQMASCGMGEQEAREAGHQVVTAAYPFNDHGKSLVKGETDGFVKLVAEEPTGRILGGAVVGLEASELIHEIVVAMAFHATAAQLAGLPHYHPTLSEIWTYPAEEIAERLKS